MEPFDMCLVNGSSMIVSGPTQSGKSTFVNQTLQNIGTLFKNLVSKVYWISNQLPTIQLPAVTYIEGLPEDFDFAQVNSIIVLDDLMSEVKDNATVTNLFTRVTHRDFYYSKLFRAMQRGSEQEEKLSICCAFQKVCRQQ